MIQEAKNDLYFINGRALSFTENDLGDPNRIAVSLVSGARIMVYKKGVIDYAPDLEPEKWTLKGYSTLLAKKDPHSIYARLSRLDRTALLVFSVRDYNLDGSVNTITGVDEEGKDIIEVSEPSEEFYYVKIGSVTGTDRDAGDPGIATVARNITYDSGILNSSQDIGIKLGEWSSLFVPHYDDPKDPTKLTWIEAKSHMGIQGGVTMFIEGEGMDLPSIYDGLPIDNDTIYWVEIKDEEGNVIDKRIKARGGSGEGGIAPTLLGDLTNVGSWANAIATEDRIMVQRKDSSSWTPLNLSEIGGGSADFSNVLFSGDGNAFTSFTLSEDKKTLTFVKGQTFAEKSNTLSGYGITDAKISNGVITLGGNTITPLTSHQTIYNLTLQAGTFSDATFDPNGGDETINIPTTTSHISEGDNLYFTNARAVSALSDTLKVYVTLSGTQTITGEKDFTGGLKVNGSQIVYDKTNKYWKLTGDLVVTGGITMFANDGTYTPSTITDAVNIDNQTIIRQNGKLMVNPELTFGGNGGGEVSTVAWGNIIGKPNTISGYGITDAKISNGVITLGGNTITPLTSHQTIYNLTLKSGTFSATTFDPNGAAKTVNIPTTTSHISEGDNLYFTNARAVSALSDTLKAYVTLSGTQTITGEKDFTGGLKVNGSQIVYDKTNKYWKLTGDLVVTGGITMFANDGTYTPSTITDAVNIDNQTIIRQNGKLMVNPELTFGGNGGGEVSTVAWGNILGKPTTISGYGITDANISNGVITLGNTTITPLTQTLGDARYVTGLGTSGNDLTWVKNGTTNKITIPYSVKSKELSSWKVLTIKKNQDAGTIYKLIANLTNWKTGYDAQWGIIGVMYGHRGGNMSGTCIQNIVAYCASYSSGGGGTNFELKTDVTSYVKPYIVSYNGVNYLALRMTGSGSAREHCFLGYTENLLDEFIEVSESSVSILHETEVMSMGGVQANSSSKLATARMIWGQLFDGTDDVSGDMTGVGSLTMDGQLSLNGITIKKSASGALFIDGNLVVSGGVTMYGTDGTTSTTIWDNAPIANTQGKKGVASFDSKFFAVNNGVVTFIGSTGGGVADSVAWGNVTGIPSWITATKPEYQYTEIKGIPDLTGYITSSGNQTITGEKTFESSIKIKRGFSILDDQGWGVVGVNPTEWTGLPEDGSVIGFGTGAAPVYIRTSGDDLYHYDKNNDSAYKIIDSNNIVNYKAGDSIKFNGFSMRSNSAFEDKAVDANINYVINATSLSTSYFYPVIFPYSVKDLYVRMYSTSGTAAAAYNQNKLEFTFRGQGWNDAPNGLTVHFYSCYDAKETTIGCIAMGEEQGYKVVWVRGGLTYYVTSNITPTLYKDGVTFTNEKYSYGVNFYGGTNTKVKVYWTPQTTSGLGAMYHSGSIGTYGSLNVKGISIYKSDKGYLYIDGDLVVKGGITMYGTDGTAAPTIWDGAPKATTSDTPNGKGVASFDSKFFSVSNGHVSFIGDVGGGIESITKQMVIDALGYTPYNSTNPNGYITASGSITGNAATATSLKSYTAVQFNKSDNGGNPCYLLISDATSWYSASQAGEYGIVGVMYGYRGGNMSGTCVQKMIAMCAYSKNYYELKTDVKSYVVPRIVKYNSKYYIALYMTGSGRSHYFIGKTSNMLSSFIELQCDADGLYSGLTVLYDTETMAMNGVSVPYATTAGACSGNADTSTKVHVTSVANTGPFPIIYTDVSSIGSNGYRSLYCTSKSGTGYNPANDTLVASCFSGSSVSFGDGTYANLTTKGWYRFAVGGYENSQAGAYIFFIRRQYQVSRNESFVISATVDYGRVVFNQISGATTDNLISKIRATNVLDGRVHFDFYYEGSSSAHRVYVNAIGNATLQAPTSVSSAYSYVTEMSLKNGFVAGKSLTCYDYKNLAFIHQKSGKNLLTNGDVMIKGNAYAMGSYSYDSSVTNGRTYRLTICAKLGSENTHIAAYWDGGSGNNTTITGLSSKEEMIVTFTAKITNKQVLTFYQFPNGKFGSYVRWAYLEEAYKEGELSSTTDYNNWLTEYNKLDTKSFLHKIRRIDVGDSYWSADKGIVMKGSLTLNGTIYSPNRVAAMKIANNSGAYIGVMSMDATNNFCLGYDSSASSYDTYIDGFNMHFRTGSSHTEQMKITSTGLVYLGVNTSNNENSYLKIQANSANPYIKFMHGGLGWYLQCYESSYMYLGQGSAKSFRIDANGNCLIPAGNAYGLTIKRTLSNGGAYTKYQPCNQETKSWAAGVNTSYQYSWWYQNGTSDTQKMYLDSSGNLLTTGGITMYSDLRKKTILNHVELSLKEVADAPLIEHYYNSDEAKTIHVGSVAQYWAGLNDWFCKEDGEGFLTMEIQNAALASAISVARELTRYESKTDKQIKRLKKRIGELEEEIENLKNK